MSSMSLRPKVLITQKGFKNEKRLTDKHNSARIEKSGVIPPNVVIRPLDKLLNVIDPHNTTALTNLRNFAIVHTCVYRKKFKCLKLTKIDSNSPSEVLTKISTLERIAIVLIKWNVCNYAWSVSFQLASWLVM